MHLCISDNLRMLRQKHGYTLEALAEILSVSRQTVAKWEADISLPDLQHCAKLAALYQVTMDELTLKPLHAAMISDYTVENDSLCGIASISEDGSVQLHSSVLELCDLHPGEQILLLADKKRGVALLKCSPFN